MFPTANSIESQLLVSSPNARTVALVGPPAASKLVWSPLQSKCGSKIIELDP